MLATRCLRLWSSLHSDLVAKGLQAFARVLGLWGLSRKMEMKTVCMWAVVLAVLLLQQGYVNAEVDGLEFVKKTVASHPLVVFSKSYCPYCKRAKSVFEEMNEKAYVVELDLRDDGDSIQQALHKYIGRRTVPQVFINGEHIGGSDDTIAAHQSGKLKKLLKWKEQKSEL